MSEWDLDDETAEETFYWSCNRRRRARIPGRGLLVWWWTWRTRLLF
jgi:hypothetical protein